MPNRIYLVEPAYDGLTAHPSAVSAILLRLPITATSQSRNIRLVSIDYAFRPRLRDRLTLSGLTFLRKP